MIDPKIKQELKVNIRMGRDSGGRWNLTIEDDASSSHIIEVHMNDKQFANLMANCGANCSAEYWANPNIGKELIAITFGVPLKPLGKIFQSFGDSKKMERDMKHVYDYAEELNPGFKADRFDKYNGHRKIGDFYNVTLRRYGK
jgi:hypothetical protein